MERTSTSSLTSRVLKEGYLLKKNHEAKKINLVSITIHSYQSVSQLPLPAASRTPRPAATVHCQAR